LYTEAEEAFTALEMLLGKDEWFFNNKEPTLFDASVFAYTHLLLDNKLGRGWVNTSLRDYVTQKSGLVKHRNRILESYFSSH
jgi:metaxin